MAVAVGRRKVEQLILMFAAKPENVKVSSPSRSTSTASAPPA